MRYNQILEEFGYGSSGAVSLSATNLPRFADGTQYGNDLIDMMSGFALRGWLMILLDHAMSSCREFWDALPEGLGRKIIVVPTDATVDTVRFQTRPETICVEYSSNLDDTIRSAARKMLAARA